MAKDTVVRSPFPMLSYRLARAALPAIAAGLVLLGGCADMQDMSRAMKLALTGNDEPPKGTVVIQPLAPVRRDIFTRSYRLGDTYSARTGGTVVSVKNYAVTERVGRATALRDFAQTCKPSWPRKGPVPCDSAPLASVRGGMGSVFDVVGAVTFADGQYFAVALPPDGRSQVYLLVDPTGRLRKTSYVAWREDMSPGYVLGRVPLVEMEPDVAIDPETPLFSFESVEKFVYMGPGYLSFDLLYTGTRDTLRGELYTFSYREYGRDSTDRPAFEKPLQFPVGEPVIEVPPLRIELEPVGYNEIRFRVIADGQPKPTTR